MFYTLAKLLKVTALIALVLAGVVLSVQNRVPTDISFYPLPYVLTLPLFLFAIIMFVAGILLGWTMSRFSTFKVRRASKDAGKRIAALENELTALRSEQLIKPAAITSR